MKKFFIISLSIFIISVILIVTLKDKFSLEKIISNIENQNDINIQMNGISTILFYPSINFKNENVNIRKKDIQLLIKKAGINISKSYWPTSSVIIELITPVINFRGLELRDVLVNASYKNKNIQIKKFVGKITEGNIKLFGNINIDKKQIFQISGNFLICKVLNLLSLEKRIY